MKDCKSLSFAPLRRHHAFASTGMPWALAVVAFFISTAWGNSVTLTSGTAGTIADAFVVSGSNSNANPNWCYGGAGALVVAGANTANGEYQTVLKFDLQYVKNFYDNQYGIGNWHVDSITLTLSSNAAFQGQQPNNPIFTQINAGGFAIDWMANNNWSEGLATANPSTPYVPTNAPVDGVTFNSLSTLRSASDQTLGLFYWGAPSGTVISNPISLNGSGGQVSTTWTLSLQSGILADVASGGLASLRLYATDSATAYLFNSKTKGPDYWPVLEVFAIPEPSTGLLMLAGVAVLAFLAWRRDSVAIPKNHANHCHCAAFTLVELMASIAVVGVLTSLAAAAVGAVRGKAESIQCMSNLRQWSSALHLYCNDNDGFLPRRGQGVQPVWVIDRQEDWFNALPPYFGEKPYSEQVQDGCPAKPGQKSVFVCPSAKEKGNYPHFLCYGMNMYLSPWIRPESHRLSELPNPSQLVFMADGPGGWASTIPSRAAYSVEARHNGRANIAFMDGHIESLDGKYIGCGTGEPTRPDIRWQTLSGGVNQVPLP